MSTEETKNEIQKLKDEKYHLLKLINHDVRSPFNRIYALLQLFELDSKQLTKMQKEYLDSMYLSILSGLEMIQNLRDMREIDAGNIASSPTDTDLHDLLQKCVRTYSKQMELKNIHVKTTVIGDFTSVLLDDYYLQRIIENLLSNAIKFSKQGSEVFISASTAMQQLRIEVRDFGEGIKPDERPKLFQKFTKLSAFATGGEGSLGLGLYNTGHFVKLMKGKIELEEAFERGSNFIVTLPSVHN